MTILVPVNLYDLGLLWLLLLAVAANCMLVWQALKWEADKNEDGAPWAPAALIFTFLIGFVGGALLLLGIVMAAWRPWSS